MNKTLRKEKILNVQVTSSTIQDILEYIITRLENKNEKLMIFTPNPEMVVAAQHHVSLKSTLNRAQIALPDGVGLMWGAVFLGHPLKQRITGVDFMENLCEKFSKGVETIGLLGGRGKVAEMTANCLRQKYPSLHIVYIAEEWDEADFKKQLAASGRDHLDVLFVAFGFPKQEEWITGHLEHIPVRAAMGVGGAFDYLSGKVGRAPRFVRQLGFEWLWRLVRQPWRVRRQLALIEFLALVFKERFTGNSQKADNS